MHAVAFGKMFYQQKISYSGVAVQRRNPTPKPFGAKAVLGAKAGRGKEAKKFLGRRLDKAESRWYTMYS